MLNEHEEDIMSVYRDGGDLGYISKIFNISEDNVRSTLNKFRELNKHKRTFNDEFKKVIAERDLGGVSRRQISLELNINANTVKRACERFGQAVKEKTHIKEEEYTVIRGVHSMDKCPTCNSLKVNEVDDNVTYCLNCGNEHVYKKNCVLKVNWEFFD